MDQGNELRLHGTQPVGLEEWVDGMTEAGVGGGFQLEGHPGEPGSGRRGNQVLNGADKGLVVGRDAGYVAVAEGRPKASPAGAVRPSTVGPQLREGVGKGLSRVRGSGELDGVPQGNAGWLHLKTSRIQRDFWDEHRTQRRCCTSEESARNVCWREQGEGRATGTENDLDGQGHVP